MPPTSLLKLEGAIARAHRQVWGAHNAAEEAGQEGMAHDLWQILKELERCQHDLVQGRKRRSPTTC